MNPLLGTHSPLMSSYSFTSSENALMWYIDIKTTAKSLIVLELEIGTGQAATVSFFSSLNIPCGLRTQMPAVHHFLPKVTDSSLFETPVRCRTNSPDTSSPSRHSLELDLGFQGTRLGRLTAPHAIHGSLRFIHQCHCQSRCYLYRLSSDISQSWSRFIAPTA